VYFPLVTRLSLGLTASVGIAQSRPNLSAPSIFPAERNIWTFDGKDELLLTIMSSLAQEESRGISENVT